MNADDLQLLVTYTMPYGKYEGRVIADLPGNYLNWFARQGFPSGKLGQLLALMHELDPDPRLAPARDPGVHHADIPETLGQVAPRYACSISVQHRFHKEGVVCGGDPNVPSTPRQQILDAFPLVVSVRVALSSLHPSPVR